MKPQKFTDDEAAFAAYQWACGRSQRKIGAMFGVSAATVCLAISDFIKSHSQAKTDRYGRLLDNEMPRQRLAGIVAEHYCKHRNGKLRLRIVARTVKAKESGYEDLSG